MATYPRHKKARLIRDYMIEKDLFKMFKEDDDDKKVVYFRTAYPMNGESKPVVINIDDSPYIAVQILLKEGIDESIKVDLYEKLNEISLELPPVKFVITPDHSLVASMFFPTSEKAFDAEVIVRIIIEFIKTMGSKAYPKIETVFA